MLEPSTSSRAWRPTSEDNVSTGSTDSNASTSAPHNSETVLLRFPNTRRVVGKYKKNAGVAMGTIGVMVVCGVLFGYVHSMSSGGGQQGIKVARSTGNIVVTDMLQSSSSSSSAEATNVIDRMQGDQPRSARARSSSGITRSNTVIVPSIVPQEPSSQNSTAVAEPTPTPSRKRKANRRQHRPLRLPADAQERPPLSLLYQMKLISGSSNSVFNSTICNEDVDGRHVFKGWRVEFSVNATAAAIDESENKFVGYAKKKTHAKAKAAEKALLKIYPGKLVYNVEDLREIKEACGDALEE